MQKNLSELRLEVKVNDTELIQMTIMVTAYSLRKYKQEGIIYKRKERIFEKALSSLFMACGVAPLDQKSGSKF